MSICKCYAKKHPNTIALMHVYPCPVLYKMAELHGLVRDYTDEEVWDQQGEDAGYR